MSTPIDTKKTLTVGCWNARGIMAKTQFFTNILQKKHFDIFGLCEHWLYPDSLPLLSSLDPTYAAYGISDTNLDIYDQYRRGKGGVAILWRKDLDVHVTYMSVSDDRIIGLSMRWNNSPPLHIVMVYLPSVDHGKEPFLSCLNKVMDIYEHYTTTGEVIIMGDFNCIPKKEDCLVYTKYMQTQTNIFDQLMTDIRRDNNLLDTWRYTHKGKSEYTHYSPKNASRIDLIYLDKTYIKNQTTNINNQSVFDHRSVTIEINKRNKWGKGRNYSQFS